MTITLTYTPVYPIPDDVVTLVGTTGQVGTSVDFELTSIPDESALTLGRLRNNSDELIATFTPDQPGEYGFTIYDYRDTGFAPARWRDDITAQRGKRLLSTSTGTVYVGEAVDLPIVTLLGHGATLRLTIVNETVRVATLVNPLTELSRVVCLDSTLTSPLAALVGVTVANLGNDLVTAVAELVAKFQAHRILITASVHSMADSVNAMLRSYSSTYSSQAYAIAQLNEVRERIESHARTGSSGGGWHRNDDTKNTFLVGPASDLASAYVLFADAGFRVYERHRVLIANPDAHGAADATNTLTAASVLTLFIVAFLDAIAIVDPSPPAGESEGAADAAHRYGFKRAT
jgi:hypothetical protein